MPHHDEEPTADRQVVLDTPPVSWRQIRVVFAIFGFITLQNLFLILVASAGNRAMFWLPLIGTGVMAVAAGWMLYDRGRRRERRVRLFLRPGGWRWRWRKGEPPAAKFGDYPDLAFVRVEATAGVFQARLLSRAHAPRPLVLFGHPLTFKQVNRTHSYVNQTLGPALHRRVAEARDVVPGGRETPNLERVGRVSHCPECGYALAGLPQQEHNRCPECGWGWSAGDVVLYGRRGPTGRRSLGFGGVALVLVAGLGGGVIGALTTFVPIFLLFWAWRNLPPSASYAVTAVVLVGGIAFFWWLIRRATLGGEADREKADRLGDARTGPAGTTCLRLQRGGFSVAPILARGVEITPWDEATTWRVQRWPGGVRVRCDRAGKRHRWWRSRPVDFLCDLADPDGDVPRLRQALACLPLKPADCSPPA